MCSTNTAELEQQFIEDVGIYCDQLGMPKMAGRIFARLLICDPRHQSQQELADYLQASKGSISTSSRMLIQLGIMERVCFPKDRNDYYRIKSNVWPEHFRSQMDRFIVFKKLIARGLDILKNSPKTKKDRLSEMWDFYCWLEEEVPRLFDRWEKHNYKIQGNKVNN